MPPQPIQVNDIYALFGCKVNRIRSDRSSPVNQDLGDLVCRKFQPYRLILIVQCDKTVSLLMHVSPVFINHNLHPGIHPSRKSVLESTLYRPVQIWCLPVNLTVVEPMVSECDYSSVNNLECR